MNLFSFEGEGGLQQGNVMFKTNQPSNPSNVGVEYFQITGIAHSPDGTLRMSRHELPVPSHDLTVIIDEQDRVVEG